MYRENNRKYSNDGTSLFNKLETKAQSLTDDCDDANLKAEYKAGRPLNLNVDILKTL